MKQDWEIYRDTGILGAYRPEQVILRRSEDGGVETLFRDSTAKWEGDDLTRQRAMLVDGKCFLVTSVFPGGAWRRKSPLKTSARRSASPRVRLWL